MCFRPAAISTKPKCPTCGEEIDVVNGMVSCPKCGHEFTPDEIRTFANPFPSLPGVPRRPGIPRRPGAPDAPKASEAPPTPKAPGQK